MNFRLKLKSGAIIVGCFMQTLYGYSNIETGESYGFDDVECILPLGKEDVLRFELKEWSEISSKLAYFITRCSDEHKAYIMGELEALLDFIKEEKK